ncbi:hypothetical protein HID58_096202 [Brassica napus]|uniref:Serine aminopeptidase S33 domain-containing protein n=1 Tax=Brassica napus TaxID=3708 RepID=A0ABQ7X2P0_BRANA|nr:hypothetical protein HID58_096202 [Brassica napus]
MVSQIFCKNLRMDSSEKSSAQRIVIPNRHKEKLVGLLHETGSREVVILCHGFQSNKDNQTMNNVAATLEKEGITAFRFDFSGMGICFSLSCFDLVFWEVWLRLHGCCCCRESEGSFYYGNYNHEADDLRSVVQHFSNMDRVEDVVLLYASKYHDIRNVINLSGRYDLKKGITERLGKIFWKQLSNKGSSMLRWYCYSSFGFIALFLIKHSFVSTNVLVRGSQQWYRVTEET